MFCPKCGDAVENNEIFCNKCGYKLVSSTDNLANQNMSNQASSVSAFNNMQTNSFSEPVLIPISNIDSDSSLNNNIDNSQVVIPNDFKFEQSTNILNASNNQTNNIQTINQANNIQNISQDGNMQSNDIKQDSSLDAKRQYEAKMRGIMARRKKKQKKLVIFASVTTSVCLLIIVFISLYFFTKSSYYFSSSSYGKNNEITYSDGSFSQNKYSTIIITDNTYNGVKISNSTDAINLISKDSLEQKGGCPANIKIIEERMIKNYGITAVNLCEMDIGFAEEIEKVFKTIYNEYPSIRGYLTNVSLINAPMSQGYIAAFMPMFSFATADSSSGYPWVIKTQVLLNTTYFLNPNRLNESVKDGSSSGHFPPNATIYSPVAHELGHYLSFLSMMRHYDMDSLLLIDNNNIDKLYSLYEDFGRGEFSLSMITEAYNIYKKTTNNPLAFDDWRATISSYAVAKDNSGNYIYDETIAEAFHDVYLNGNKAKDASKTIVGVLKKKLEG